MDTDIKRTARKTTRTIKNPGIAVSANAELHSRCYESGRKTPGIAQSGNAEVYCQANCKDLPPTQHVLLGIIKAETTKHEAETIFISSTRTWTCNHRWRSKRTYCVWTETRAIRMSGKMYQVRCIVIEKAHGETSRKLEVIFVGNSLLSSVWLFNRGYSNCIGRWYQ